MKLIYAANIRWPTEKAHGLQIAQNCEAFAQAGADVTLWVPRRANTPAMCAISDPWAHYGVARVFDVRRLPAVDLMPLAAGRAPLEKLAFAVQTLTFALAVLLAALIVPRADAFYTRDLTTLLALSLVKPRRALAYEPHRRSQSRIGRRLQDIGARRAGAVFPITPPLAQALIEGGLPQARVMVAHDGVRRDRFHSLSERDAARREVGWPPEAFIVGYVGQLHTMGMDKGLGTLVDALAQLEGAALALVGGPEDMAAALRRRWLARGLPEADFLYAGQVAPVRVPLYLRAFDVCAMTFPWTQHYAHYASPLKLFEYMAAGRPVVASDLPAWADVVQDGETALLVPPGDVNALAAAIARLRADPDLRRRLGDAARARALARYTWDARARAILQRIQAQPEIEMATSEEHTV
ncbi:MAG: glycosyltransferase [Aggregatilineales bacterium]